MVKMLDGITKHYDYVEFVKEYVTKIICVKFSFQIWPGWLMYLGVT